MELDLIWTHCGYVRPDRTVGEQCGYLLDFEVDREETDEETLSVWDALDDDEQERIVEAAHERALRDME